MSRRGPKPDPSLRLKCNVCDENTPSKKLCPKCRIYYNKKLREIYNDRAYEGYHNIDRLFKDTEYAMSLSEVAQEMGISAQAVQMIEKRALSKLARMSDAKLRDFLYG